MECITKRQLWNLMKLDECRTDKKPDQQKIERKIRETLKIQAITDSVAEIVAAQKKTFRRVMMSSARCVEVADTVLFTREEAETASDERPAKIQKLDREE